MNYLESIYQEYGSKVGIQPLEIIASDVNGLYVFPDGNDLLRKCQLLAVTARAVSGTLYSPLNKTLLPDTVTNNTYLTLKCNATDIISRFSLEIITDMEAQGRVHPINIKGLTLNESFLSVSQAATVMSGQSGKSFLLHFYGLFY